MVFDNLITTHNLITYNISNMERIYVEQALKLLPTHVLSKIISEGWKIVVFDDVNELIQIDNKLTVYTTGVTKFEMRRVFVKGAVDGRNEIAFKSTLLHELTHAFDAIIEGAYCSWKTERYYNNEIEEIIEQEGSNFSAYAQSDVKEYVCTVVSRYLLNLTDFTTVPLTKAFIEKYYYMCVNSLEQRLQNLENNAVTYIELDETYNRLKYSRLNKENDRYTIQLPEAGSGGGSSSGSNNVIYDNNVTFSTSVTYFSLNKTTISYIAGSIGSNLVGTWELKTIMGSSSAVAVQYRRFMVDSRNSGTTDFTTVPYEQRRYFDYNTSRSWTTWEDVISDIKIRVANLENSSGGSGSGESSGDLTGLTNKVNSLETQHNELKTKQEEFENNITSTVSGIESRVTILESAGGSGGSGSSADVTALQTKVNNLEEKHNTFETTVTNRVNGIENRVSTLESSSGSGSTDSNIIYDNTKNFTTSISSFELNKTTISYIPETLNSNISGTWELKTIIGSNSATAVQYRSFILDSRNSGITDFTTVPNTQRRFYDYNGSRSWTEWQDCFPSLSPQETKGVLSNRLVLQVDCNVARTFSAYNYYVVFKEVGKDELYVLNYYPVTNSDNLSLSDNVFYNFNTFAILGIGGTSYVPKQPSVTNTSSKSFSSSTSSYWISNTSGTKTCSSVAKLNNCYPSAKFDIVCVTCKPYISSSNSNAGDITVRIYAGLEESNSMITADTQLTKLIEYTMPGGTKATGEIQTWVADGYNFETDIKPLLTNFDNANA